MTAEVGLCRQKAKINLSCLQLFQDILCRAGKQTQFTGRISLQKRLQEIRNRCNRRGIIKRDAERRERDCGGELSLIAFKKNVQLFHGEIAQSKDCGYGTDEKRLFHSITFFRRLKVEALLNVFHASKDKDGVLAGETGVRCYIEIDGAVVLDSHDVDVVFFSDIQQSDCFFNPRRRHGHFENSVFLDVYKRQLMVICLLF